MKKEGSILAYDIDREFRIKKYYEMKKKTKKLKYEEICTENDMIEDIIKEEQV